MSITIKVERRKIIHGTWGGMSTWHKRRKGYMAQGEEGVHGTRGGRGTYHKGKKGYLEHGKKVLHGTWNKGRKWYME